MKFFDIVWSRKRPIGVWIISMFYFFFALYCFYLGYSGKVLANQTFTVIITATLIVTIILVAAVLLFCLRKQAFYFFALFFAMDLLSNVLIIYSNGLGEGEVLVATLFKGGIIAAILLYIKKLEKNGILH